MCKYCRDKLMRDLQKRIEQEPTMEQIKKMKWKRIVRETGLIEWQCEHGIGHPDVKSAKKMGEGWGIHGCDGCCLRDDFPGGVHDRTRHT